MKNGIKITRYNSKNDDYMNKNFAYSTLGDMVAFVIKGGK